MKRIVLDKPAFRDYGGRERPITKGESWQGATEQVPRADREARETEAAEDPAGRRVEDQEARAEAAEVLVNKAL